MNIDYTDLQKALSHVLYLIKKCSLQRARIKQKQLKSKFFLTISYNVNIISINSFTENLFIWLLLWLLSSPPLLLALVHYYQ